jgi:hypothetical protein
MNANIDCLNSTLSAASARIGRCKAALATASLLLAGAGLCQASSVVTVTAQNLWDSSVIYTLETNPVATSGCGDQTVSAPAQIAKTTVVDGSPVTVTYGFLFWDVNARLHTNPTVKFQPICGSANSVVAVYWPLGGGGTPGTTDAVLAYSLPDHKIVPGSPIASASSGWTAGSTSVTTPSTIEALPKLPPYGEFKAWDILGQPYSSSSSLALTEPDEVVLAFYGFPDPDPCQTLRNEIATDSYCTGDGVSASSCAKLLMALDKELEACEVEYGEALPLP